MLSKRGDLEIVQEFGRLKTSNEFSGYQNYERSSSRNSIIKVNFIKIQFSKRLIIFLF